VKWMPSTQHTAGVMLGTTSGRRAWRAPFTTLKHGVVWAHSGRRTDGDAAGEHVVQQVVDEHEVHDGIHIRVQAKVLVVVPCTEGEGQCVHVRVCQGGGMSSKTLLQARISTHMKLLAQAGRTGCEGQGRDMGSVTCENTHHHRSFPPSCPSQRQTYARSSPGRPTAVVTEHAGRTPTAPHL